MPKKPYKFFLDADSPPYAGASCGEQTYYTWFRNNEEGDIIDQSEDFTKADDATSYIWTQTDGDVPASLRWYRETKVELLPVEKALKATKDVMNNYMKTCEKFCRDGYDPIYMGFLTPSGIKNKDIKGLENQYQFNRIGLPRPFYLKECRNFLISNYDWIKMAKDGWEADTHVVAMAEKAGEDGCILTIDKDLHQAYETWYINCFPLPYLRECRYATSLGSLWIGKTPSGKEKIRGDGFKWLCLQAISGDTSDGYKGLNLYGDKKAYKLLKDLNSRKECLIAIKKVYEAKFKRGYTCKRLKDKGVELNKGVYVYESWDGQIVVPTVSEIMNQHFFLAYQERSATDIFKVEDYL